MEQSQSECTKRNRKISCEIICKILESIVQIVLFQNFGVSTALLLWRQREIRTSFKALISRKQQYGG